MSQHNTSAYKDGNKWVVYCVNCGVEENDLALIACNERYVDKSNQKEADGFKTGLDKIVESK